MGCVLERDGERESETALESELTGREWAVFKRETGREWAGLVRVLEGRESLGLSLVKNRFGCI